MDPKTVALQALTVNESTGLVMDFDGVLSEITDDPSASELLPGTETILASLATKLSVVALLSGRPVSFLADRASIPGVELYGSYGLEHLTDKGIDVDREAQHWMGAVQEATGLLHRELDGVDGLYVEEKSLAVAIHWRQAPDQDQARHLIVPLIQKITDTYGLRREPGKMVEELRMPLEPDKGTALKRIIATNNLNAVAYAGDDLGDLPAFEAVIGAGGYALVVDGADTAPKISQLPGVHFDGPQSFQDWLQRLDDKKR